MSPYELAVGLRYTRARKGSGRNTFISFIGLMSIMDGFRVFDSVLILTSQNSAYVSSVLTYNFRVAMSYEQLGKASAINNIAVVIIMVLMVPMLIWTYREQLETA